MDVITRVRSLPRRFWLLNIMQMIERLAYWCVLVQMPVYIAQKDEAGGLHWDHATKGIIFFWWALFQNLTPVFSGGFADKYGFKRVLSISFVIVLIGYFVMGSQRDIILFTAGTIILGIGSGIFKPSMQGAIASNLSEENSSVGWGVHFMLINAAVFLGPPLSVMLKDISWEAIFIGSGVVFSFNFIALYFMTFPKPEETAIVQDKVLRHIFRGLAQPQIAWFVLIMSGFILIYMQFYETLPNFILDWSDTSKIADALSLPAALLKDTPRGTMIRFEYIYNINTGLTFLGIVIIAWLFSKRSKLLVLMIGVSVATAGLFLSGYSMSGCYLIGGVMIYSLGEMITNPKITDYIGGLAPKSDKGLYMSYISISFAIGLAGGGLLGGYLYEVMGEKSGFAIKYIRDNFGIEGVAHVDAMAKLRELTGLDAAGATELLWNTYSPSDVWLPFLFIGIATVIGLLVYSRSTK